LKILTEEDFHSPFGGGKVSTTRQFLSPLHCGFENSRQAVNKLLFFVTVRGTFVEFRTGMINVSPVGRNASSDERNAYEKYDKEHKIRETFIQEIHKQFPDIGLTYSIGNPSPYSVDERRTNFV
jgi:Eukaryotic phosphomannomutase